MSERLDPDVWVPITLRWRHIQVGETFVAPAGRLWTVVGVEWLRGALAVTATAGLDKGTYEMDPDDTAQVLYPVQEVDAIGVLREQLGARLIESRDLALVSSAVAPQLQPHPLVSPQT